MQQPNESINGKIVNSSALLNSEDDKYLLELANFINTRQQQKHALENAKINSLSKNNQTIKNNSKVKNKNFAFNQEFFDLIKLLDSQLSEGHTVLTVFNISDTQRQMFNQWEQLGWITQLSRANISNTSNDLTSKQSRDLTTNVNSPLVVELITVNSQQTNAIVWLHRQWYTEHQLAQQLLKLAKQGVKQPIQNKKGVNRGIHLNNTDRQHTNKTTLNPAQQLAIENAQRYALTIITGGPGTGKTFTVAKLVTQLQNEHHIRRREQPFLPPLSIALTAPTGKAAQRMQESLMKSLAGETIELDDAKTLHRLLGINQTGTPRYHAGNPLPYDLIIVDEASMLGLELASLLVDAIKPTARLILLGDANQLAAVDAGAVLFDLCQVPQLEPYRTHLTESKRFDDRSLVGQFARAVNQEFVSTKKTKSAKPTKTAIEAFNKAKLKQIHQLLTTCDFHRTIDDNALNFFPIDANSDYRQVYDTLSEGYAEFFELMKTWYVHAPDIRNFETRQQMFELFDSYRILTAGHQGQLGSATINQKLSTLYHRTTKLPKAEGFFYHGLPVMMTHNDYQLGLFNGDIGICLEVDKTIWVCFADKVIASSRLSRESCEPAYAMTIHKSQGSEFDKVAICFDRVHLRLLSQALIYTAITRSKGKLMMIGQINLLNYAILQQGNRQTGLALQFD